MKCDLNTKHHFAGVIHIANLFTTSCTLWRTWDQATRCMLEYRRQTAYSTPWEQRSSWRGFLVVVTTSALRQRTSSSTQPSCTASPSWSSSRSTSSATLMSQAWPTMSSWSSEWLSSSRFSASSTPAGSSGPCLPSSTSAS